MKFLFDENIPPRISRALKQLGENVDHVVDLAELGSGTPDDQILRHAARCDYRIITLDRRIKRTPHLRALIYSERVGIYFVHCGKKENPDLWDLFEILVRNWPEVKRHAERGKPPYTMQISRKGALKCV